MKPVIPLRVRVMSGDQSEYLGIGTLLDNVTIYCVKKKDGSLQSLRDAEQPPPKDMVEEGDKVLKLDNNPKIKMDDGTVRYGCQVWWSPLEVIDNN